MDEHELAAAHLAAVVRQRRIVVNLDTGWGLPGVEDLEPQTLVDANMEYLTGMPGSQVDSIWWCWGEMNYAPYPSDILPVNEAYQKWHQRGLDPLPLCIERCRSRGLETFYTFRINGANDFGDWALPPVLVEHPEWGIPSRYWPAPWRHFDFTREEVRQYKLALVREVAQRYDFDGIEIDWRAGLTTLPPLHAWEHREALTDFVRSVRQMLQAEARRRTRPCLLAVRVPETLEGCHWDGLHVERWVEEGLVDILALGCKSFDVDLDAFRRLVHGRPVRLYPSLDDHHRASGYEEPTLELYRGAAATFLEQGADGIYAFNWYGVAALLDQRTFPAQEQLRRQALCEMGSRDTLARADKRFVTQRRGGGGWPETAEHFYANTSAFAQLPQELASDPADETYVFLRVGDDLEPVAAEAVRIELRVLLHDPAAAGLPWPDRIHGEPVRVARHSRREFAEPPLRALVTQLRVRINGVLLDPPDLTDGWLLYPLRPVHLARGGNVVAFRLESRAPEAPGRVTVEKLEIDVRYA